MKRHFLLLTVLFKLVTFPFASKAQCIIADSAFVDVPGNGFQFYQNTKNVSYVMDSLLYSGGWELSPFGVTWNGDAWNDSLTFVSNGINGIRFDNKSKSQLVTPPLHWCPNDTMKALQFASAAFNGYAGAIAFRLSSPLKKDSTYKLPFVYVADGSSRASRSVKFMDSMRFSLSVFSSDTSEVYRENYTKNGTWITYDTLNNYEFIERIPRAYNWKWNRYWLEFKATATQDGHDWIILHEGQSAGLLLNFDDARKMMDIPINMDTLVFCSDTSVSLNQDTFISSDTSWLNKEKNWYVRAVDSFYYAKPDSKGCKSVDCRKLEYIPKQAGLLDSLFYCDYDSVKLSINVPGINKTQVSWSTGDTVSSFYSQDSGWIWVDISQGYCSFRDSIHLLHYDKPVFQLGKDTFICSGDTLHIGLVVPMAVLYQWNTGADSAITPIDTYGEYVLTVHNSNCYSSDTIVVSYRDLPLINLVNDTTFCNTDSVQIDVASPNISIYTWDDGPSTSMRYLKQNGTYRITFSDGLCWNSDSAIAHTDAPIPFSLGSDSSFCVGGQWSRDMSYLNADDYIWNETIHNTTYTSSSTEQIRLRVQNGTCFTHDTIEITVNSYPSFSLQNDTIICTGDSLFIGTLSAADTYNWTDGLVSPQRWVSSTGKYVLALDNKGCITKDSMLLTVDLADSIFLGRDTILCTGKELFLDGSISNATSYAWSDFVTSPSRAVSDSGTYTLIANTRACGAFTDSINITFENCDCYYWMPNAFSPNILTDNINSLFKPTINCPLLSYTLHVFNRWGELIYQSNDITNAGWDGNYLSQPCPTGLYLWQLKFQYSTGKIENHSGTILLRR